MRTVVASTFAACLLSAFGAARADAQMPPAPGPEHQILASEAGTWDAALEMTGPDGSPMRATGVEEDTLSCGGRCLVSSFKSEMMPGMTFEGRGISTWDATKKKYVSAWTDSMGSGMGMSEGTYDAATKVMTSWMEMADMTGKVVKTRSVVEYPDPDHKVMTMFAPGPDGKEVQAMKISYTRRK